MRNRKFDNSVYCLVILVFFLHRWWSAGVNHCWAEGWCWGGIGKEVGVGVRLVRLGCQLGWAWVE